MRADTLNCLGEPAYAAVRVQHKHYTVQCAFEPHFCGGCAGLALVQNDTNQLRIECFDDGGSLEVQAVQAGENRVICVKPLPAERELALKLTVHGLAADIPTSVPSHIVRMGRRFRLEPRLSPQIAEKAAHSPAVRGGCAAFTVISVL